MTDDDIPSPDDTKIANLDQLQITAAKFEDIRSFLAYVDTFERDSVQDKDEDSVSLMTIHKAKGLEFPIVFLIGLVEGILPTKEVWRHRRREKDLLCRHFTSDATFVSEPLENLPWTACSKIHFSG